MNKNLEEIILQAIDIVASKKIASASYDKTILATVVSCEDEKTGKYKVKYQDSFWYAYSNNININYSKGANVYVLIPKGDMKQDKTILGGVRQLGVNYKNIAGGSSEEEQEALPINGKSVYVLNGQNLISNNIVLSLCSYRTETKVLYSKDVSAQENIIKINKENAKEYLTNSNALAISMDIQNNLDFQQRYQGNYGVLVGLDFKDNATGDIVTRYYTLDIDNMTGNPYYYPNIVNQSQVFDIDGSNFEQINLISLFIRDFPKQDDTKDNDIFITNFQIGGASVLSQNDLLSYSLNIITPKGYIFNEYSASDEERTMQAELRSKGRVVTFKPEDMSIYWFVENGSITTRNEKYSKYGGQGWACLNEYGIIQDQILDADGELVSPAIYGFLPSQVDYYTVKKSEILAKSTKFKCVVIYNENILSKEISILRHDSEYDIYITSDAGVKFYYDSGNPTLTCYCKHKQPNGTYTNVDISNLSFVWSMIDNIGNFSSLESQSNDKKKLTLIKQNILSYLNLEYITLEDIVDTSVIFPSDYAIAQLQDGQLKTEITEIKQNFISNGIEDQNDIVELFNTYDIETGNSITYNLFLNGDINHTRTITNAIKNYSNDQRVVDNQILNLSVRNITKFATFKCSVFTKVGNRFLGTGSITISNSLSTEDEYTLIINNGNQLFKYNTHGISPTSKRLSNPQEIPLLSFSLYDPQGNEIEEQKLLTSDISWTIPVKNTLLKANSNYSGGIPSEDLKTITYKKLMTFSYTIAESYNIKKTNNDIQLKIVYNGMTLTTSTNLIFTKEGQQGTNGTQFVCKIIPNVESGETPVYPTIYYDGTNVSFNWDQDAQKPWFKVQLWHNDFEPIFVGTSSGNSTEDKLVTIEKWQVLRNIYKKNADDALAVQDQTNLIVTSNDSNNGWTFSFNPGTLRSSWTSQEYRRWRPANILKVTLNYDGNIYYGTLPVIVCRLFDANYYRSKLQDYTGFQHVLYSSAGIDPSYDSHDPFEIITEQFIDGKWNDISINGINYNFLYTGSVWYRKKENGSYVWQEEFETTDNKGESSKRWLKKRYIGADTLPVNQKAIQPVERYNGQCLNTALVCEVSRVSDEKLLAWIHMPIHFSFNRFENSAINDWDGNSVDLGAANGGTILAPQAGMGYKDENNKFTGVLMGTVKDPDADVTNQTGSKSNEQAGLFAYHQGIRTAFIDAKTGKSTFGQQGQAQIIIDPTQTNSDGRKVAQIKSGNYDQSAKTGLLIDLSTPEIKYGSGNFSIDKDGKLYARAAYVDGQLSVNTTFGSQEDSPTIGQTLSKIDSLGNEILLQVSETYATKEWVSEIQVTPESIRLMTSTLIWKSNNSEMDENGTLTCKNPTNDNIKTIISAGKVTSTGQVPIYYWKDDLNYAFHHYEDMKIEQEKSIIGFFHNNKPRGAMSQVPVVFTTSEIRPQNLYTNGSSSLFTNTPGLTITSVGSFGIYLTNKTLGSTWTQSYQAYRAYYESNRVYNIFQGYCTIYHLDFTNNSNVYLSGDADNITVNNGTFVTPMIETKKITTNNGANGTDYLDIYGGYLRIPNYLYVGTHDTNSGNAKGYIYCGHITAANSISSDGFSVTSGGTSIDMKTTVSTNVSNVVKFGSFLYLQASSSKRYKNYIRDMTQYDVKQLLNITPLVFKYKKEYGEPRKESKPIFGFFAEDFVDKYPNAVQYNQNNQVEDWNIRILVPGLLKLIQLQEKRILKLERVSQKYE